MYAVIQTGGKQYRVAQGETLRVEKLLASAGDKLTFQPLMLADDAGGVTLGKPVIAGASVQAEVIGQGLGEKIIIFKYRRRKNYRRKQGHRQAYTALKITSISAS